MPVSGEGSLMGEQRKINVGPIYKQFQELKKKYDKTKSLSVKMLMDAKRKQLARLGMRVK